MVKIAIPRIVGYHNWMAHLAQHKVSEVKQFPPPHQLSALNVSFLVCKVDKSIAPFSYICDIVLLSQVAVLLYTLKLR